MSASGLAFVTFECREGRFVGFLGLEALGSSQDAAGLLKKATRLYEKAFRKMKKLVVQINAAKKEKKMVRARQVWRVGDEIFRLTKELAELSLQLDGVYDHLTKHLKTSQDWLEKAVSFRRYLLEKERIPLGLQWKYCAKHPRRAAQQLGCGEKLK